MWLISDARLNQPHSAAFSRGLVDALLDQKQNLQVNLTVSSRLLADCFLRQLCIVGKS